MKRVAPSHWAGVILAVGLVGYAWAVPAPALRLEFDGNGEAR